MGLPPKGHRSSGQRSINVYGGVDDPCVASGGPRPHGYWTNWAGFHVLVGVYSSWKLCLCSEGLFYNPTCTPEGFPGLPQSHRVVPAGRWPFAGSWVSPVRVREAGVLEVLVHGQYHFVSLEDTAQPLGGCIFRS